MTHRHVVDMIARWAAASPGNRDRLQAPIMEAVQSLGISLSDPVKSLSGVGPRRAQQLARLGVRTVEDLARLLPIRYELRIPGTSDDSSRAVIGTVGNLDRSRRRVTLQLLTPRGPMRVLWLHRPYLAGQLRPGDWLGLWGQIRAGVPPVMIEPEIAAGPARRPVPSLHFYRSVPVYPRTSGLPQRLLRELAALAAFAAVNRPDPAAVMFAADGIVSWRQALFCIHFPSQETDPEQGRRRMELDRALGRQLWCELRRRARTDRTGISHGGSPRFADVVAGLPFSLTDGQQRALDEICGDLRAPQPMSRLLVGDVGSGKTAVAVGAAGWAALSGSQVAVLVPTELVARQHLQAFAPLTGVDLSVHMLTGGTGRKQRQQLLSKLQQHEVDVVIGTHALLEADVCFDRLGLVIIDEQHRFGVDQRRQLADKGECLDQLALTATPIPRTSALANLGHIDVSRIIDRPPGRQTVTTSIISKLTLSGLHQWCEQEIAAAGRVFIVCPRLDRDDDDVPSAIGVYRRIKETYGDRYNIGLVHGQMDSERQRTVVDKFAGGQIPVLIATTVIEVGIDVPAATLMVVLGAERFGLAALHQLRGRVGRGAVGGRCLFVPTRGQDSPRLQILADTDRGTAIALADLKLRGPGDAHGQRQHGFVQPEVTDPRLWRLARTYARRLLDQSPGLGGELRPLHDLLWPAHVMSNPRTD